MEADHRRHAEAGNAIRDLKYGVGLNHLPPGRFAANGAWLAIQVMAHNLARWTARIALGEQVATTKTLRRRFFSLAGRITRSARRLTLHLPQSWPWQEKVRPRPSPAPSHSTPSLTAPVCHRPAQRTTEVPANSRHHGPRAVPSVSSVLILPPGPIADRHRRPQERLQAARRSPAYPNTSPDNRACNSLTPFRCPHAVHLYESVDSGLVASARAGYGHNNATDWPRRAPATTAIPASGATTHCWPSPPALETC